MYHVLVLEASMVASVERGHQQALWAILTLALPMFQPATRASFLLSMGHKILKPQAGGNGPREGVIWAQSGADGGASAP